MERLAAVAFATCVLMLIFESSAGLMFESIVAGL
jgi:hypothetical protein